MQILSFRLNLPFRSLRTESTVITIFFVFNFFRFKYFKMAGLCSYNFTVGFRIKKTDIRNDGKNKLQGLIGHHFDAFLGYKYKR